MELNLSKIKPNYFVWLISSFLILVLVALSVTLRNLIFQILGISMMLPIFLVACLLIMGVLIVLIPRPKTVIYLSVILASFNYTYTLFSNANIRDTPIMYRGIKDGLLLLILVSWLFYIVKAKGKINLLRSKESIYLSIFVYLAYLLVRGVFSNTDIVSVLVSLRHLVGFALISFIVPSIFVDLKDLKRLILVLIVTTAVVALIGWLDFFLRFRTGYTAGMIVIGGERFPRVISTLGNPNLLAMSLCSILLVYAGLIIHNVQKVGSKTVVVLVLLGGCLLFTFSKGATLFLGVSILLMLILSNRFNLRWLLVIGICMITFVLANLGRSSLYGNPSALDLGSLFDRFANWPTLLASVFSSQEAGTVLFGIGTSSRNIIDSINGGDLLQLVVYDNAYLQILVENGVVGLLMLLLLLVLLFLYGIKVYQKLTIPLLKGLSLGCCGIYAFFLMYSMLAQLFTVFPSNMLFWLFVGLMINMDMVEVGVLSREKGNLSIS